LDENKIDMQWLMLQNEEPEDHVIATSEPLGANSSKSPQNAEVVAPVALAPRRD
jgi:hypothetical protein